MTLLKELIDIPEYVDKGQFVLRLTEGVTDPQATVDTYVPTPQLVKCFDDALSFIRGSLEGATSKATYLHGSFGSGKSHFMAILHLMLQGDPAAKSIPELASTIQKHNQWINGRKFLLVPYHMIGAKDVESGILGGYVDYVRRTHPESPIPGVYLAEGLFQDADALRKTMGDEAFFAKLSDSDSGSSERGWGDVEVNTWDAARFDAAVDAKPGSEERSTLIGALIKAFFGSYDIQAGGHGEAFLSLDKGLSVISKHAQSLGYDGLILFLDELILWLAGRAADLKFVHQEGQKLAKLVEAQSADRPIPIISFIARQRDLSELIGDSVPGADRANFGDALKHWEGRFHKITLEDRNLPAIAEKRVLKCKTESARAELDAAFQRTERLRDGVMTTLLTREGDRDMFRKVYPFSPALVQSLIAVSSVLQRERTALKVMMQLLVDQRDVLKVGDIVPVGDLFDVVAHGDEAFSQDMAIHFDNAKRLYHQKFLPALESECGRREDLEKLPVDDPNRVRFRNNDRLVKTLLLSALVPEVESLRGLTADRLAALNHGTIKTPIPGREGQEVLRRCRDWAASGVGEIHFGEGNNPVITVQLSGVDIDTIITQADHEDKLGNQIRYLKQMIYDQVGIKGEGEHEQYHEFYWKNTKRTCTMMFKNIRELGESSFENSNEYDWKLIIDYPVDEAGRSPRDDLSKLQGFKADRSDGAKTLCWLPQFFSDASRRDLGRLVVLEHILTGERFAQYVAHLSPQDRPAAKSLLENQRSVLRERVKSHLDAAYGLETIARGSLDDTHQLELSEQFVSLWPGFAPRPPANAVNLAGALHDLLYQALEAEFPGAPAFEAEVKPANLKKVYEVVSAAIQDPDGRVLVDQAQRSIVRSIANPLKLGEMGHDVTHFVLGRHWQNHFQKKAAETGRSMTVKQLREWLDQPHAMGLPKEAANLVILLFAEQTNRSIMRHNAPWDATLADLPMDCELVEQTLPGQAHWEAAVERAGSIFGEAPSRLLKAGNVAALAAVVKKKASDQRDPCRRYHEQLRQHLKRLDIDPSTADRVQTANATSSLIEQLHTLDPHEVIEALANAKIATTETAMGECLSKAGSLTKAIDGTNWEIFDTLDNLKTGHESRVNEIRTVLRQALTSDEHVRQLAVELRDAQSKALRLINDATQRPEPAVPEAPPVDDVPTPDPRPQRRIVSRKSRENLDLDTVQKELTKLDRSLKPGQSARVSISWIVEEEGGGDT